METYRIAIPSTLPGGMGMRPLMGFSQVCIQVYHGGEAGCVKEAVGALLAGKLARFTNKQTCADSHQ